jgi:hypothetical protein
MMWELGAIKADTDFEVTLLVGRFFLSYFQHAKSEHSLGYIGTLARFILFTGWQHAKRFSMV